MTAAICHPEAASPSARGSGSRPTRAAGCGSRGQGLHSNHRTALECHHKSLPLRLGLRDAGWTVLLRGFQIRSVEKLARAGRLEDERRRIPLIKAEAAGPAGRYALHPKQVADPGFRPYLVDQHRVRTHVAVGIPGPYDLRLAAIRVDAFLQDQVFV